MTEAKRGKSAGKMAKKKGKKGTKIPFRSNETANLQEKMKKSWENLPENP